MDGLKFYKKVTASLLFLSLPGTIASVNAQRVQCSSGALYGVTSTNQQGLYQIDPATEATTLINANIFGGGAAQTIADAGGHAGTSAIALDIHTNTLWFSNRGNGTDPVPKIFSFNLTTNAYGTVFGTHSGITAVQNFNKAAYNPVDKMVYFHNSSSNHLFRFDPATPAVPSVDLGSLSVPGFTNVANFAGGDIAFDGLGNLTGAFNNANILAIFPAQYDATGNYLGLSLSGQEFAPLNVSPASVAFLADGNYAVGATGGTSIVNTNTGVQTDLGSVNFGSSDFTSCAAPSPNVQMAKSATLDCFNRTLTYTITISNTGQFHAINTRLIDALPSGVTLNSATLNGVSFPITGLATTGVLVKSSQADTDGQLLKGDVATIVLSCSLDPGTSGPVSNQAFVKYNGIESLNLPNDRIPSDDPATSENGDPTTVARCYTLSGTVFNDDNGAADGPNGTVMAGVTVTLYASDGTTILATTVTDANGVYSFSTSPGSYIVGVTPPTGFSHISSTDDTPTDGNTSATVTNADVASVDFGLNQVMPVRLVSFRVNATETGVAMTWIAADQENFDRYEIERSLNGLDFGVVGVEVSNSLKSGSYTFTDKQALAAGSTLYYRLKMVDTDGSYAYSSIRTVSFNHSGALSATAWPTLVTSGEPITVTFSGGGGPVDVSLVSAGGREITRRQAVTTSPVELTTKNLPTGVYLIRLSGIGWQKTLKVSILK